MMRKEDLSTKSEKSFWEGRAAITSVIAVTAFLCFFTVFEIFVIKMEWNLNEAEKTEQNSTSPEQVTGLEETEVQIDVGKGQDEILTEGVTENTADEQEIAEENELDSTEVVTETEEEMLPYYIKINRQQNVITVYEPDENGEYTMPVKAILCSTGLYNATPKGVFHLSSKYIWRELNGGVYGQYASRITGGVLFHSVPYASKNKSTLYWDKYNKLGQQASMGCVRLTVEDAKWIYDNCPSGTAVEVYDSDDSGPLGKPETLKLDKDNVNKGWDPTDPDENNPWHQWSKDG